MFVVGQVKGILGPMLGGVGVGAGQLVNIMALQLRPCFDLKHSQSFLEHFSASMARTSMRAQRASLGSSTSIT